MSQPSCLICYDPLSAPLSKASPRCTHTPSICTPCLRTSISSSATTTCTHVTCPQCPTVLTPSEITPHLSTPTLTQYNHRLLVSSLSSIPEFRWCLRRGCKSGQIHDRGEEYPIVTCQECGNKTCFTHEVQWHDGQRCSEYQAPQEKEEAGREAATKRYLRGRARACPNTRCGIMIEKNGGCANMVCTLCRRGFVW